MKNILLILLMSLFLFGCSGKEDQIKPTPVPEKTLIQTAIHCPALEIIERDELPIMALSIDSNNSDTAKAYFQSIVIQSNVIKQYERIVEICIEREINNEF